MDTDYRLFACDFSYFSAKARAYFRYKQHYGTLTFEEVLATQEIIQGLIIPATGSNVIPQVQSRDGQWFQDTSEIIDQMEARHPDAPVIPTTPRQRLVSYIIELLADEWMLPWGFWERWHYSLADVQPNHEQFIAQQWGRPFAPDQGGFGRREAGHLLFREMMKIDDPASAEMGPYLGLVQLGVTKRTEAAWTESMHNMLSILEHHFDVHDYVLGASPTLADFSLMGPLYAHVYKDPVSGFMIRTQYPLICEWIDRTNGSLESGPRSYRQAEYRLDNGALTQVAGSTQMRAILADDEIPETLLPLVTVFFDEMWPVLTSSIDVLTRYINSGDHHADTSLPFKSFYSPPQHSGLQNPGGPLSHEFELRGVRESRMVSPYQVWMLQRLSDAMAAELNHPSQTLSDLLSVFDDGPQILELAQRLSGCRLRKQFEELYVADT